MELETILRERRIPFEMHHHRPVYTAQQLAQAEHVPGQNVAKPVIVKGSRGFTMCVLPAPRHLDMQRVSEVLHDSNVRLAMEYELAQLFPDCEVGAEPPIGSLYNLPTIIDRHLEEDEEIVLAAGSHERSVSLRRADWEKLCNAVVADIAIE